MLQKWFARQFAAVPAALLPGLVERLRGTPARLEERLCGVAATRLVRRRGESWSIQENVGHLGDLEPLWHGRMDDFAAGAAVLRSADLDNRATHAARHNEAPLDRLLHAFRARRAELVARFERLPDAVAARAALHPRLQQPMTPADLAFFVAEHDDHHLARISELLGGEPAGPPAARPQLFQVAMKALLVRDGRVLLVQESQPPQWWELPGGRIEAGELHAPPAEVLRRELREELGGRFACDIGAPVLCWVRAPQPDRPQPVFLVGCLCSAPRGEIELSDEHVALQWVAADGFQQLPLAPGYAGALAAFFGRGDLARG